MVCNPTCSAAIWDRFPGGEVMNLIFNYLEGYNEKIVGRKDKRGGSVVKCGETPLEGGGHVKFP